MGLGIRALLPEDQQGPAFPQSGFLPRVIPQGLGVPTAQAELFIGSHRYPRDQLPPPLLRTDVMELSDLKPGMKLSGTVRNVVDFGAFVDIGVHQDGLVHVSQITNRYIRHPSEVLSVGDVVEVTVLSVDEGKKRISLTMRGEK